MTIDGVWKLLGEVLDGRPGQEILIKSLPSEYIVTVSQTYKHDQESQKLAS